MNYRYTGSDDHIIRLRMFRKGAHDFYVKPFFPEPLIRRLEHYLASLDQ
jgi:CheY-like chemotaxis protein